MAENELEELNKTDRNKKAMLVALEKSLGVVSTACKVTGLSRAQHYNWLKTDTEYKAQVDELVEVTLDFAESKLHNRINDGDTTAIIFFLKTRGKGRGYIERIENMIGQMEQPLFGPDDPDLVGDDQLK